MSVIETVQKFIPNDVQLLRLLERVQEYAELYLLAKQRQKGCDGMGEVATLKDEFSYSMDRMIRHCREKGYISGDARHDTDSIAMDIVKEVMR
jgi:hypothetical protein